MTIDESIQRLRDDLELKDYSDSAKHMYVDSVQKFIASANKPVDDLGEEDVRRYILQLKQKRLSSQTINSYTAGIRFFFTVTLDRPLNPLKVPKMKITHSVPDVLTAPECKALISATVDVKYQAIFSLAFGSGLRISEILNLHTSDIRSEKMQVFVRPSKRRKERYTILGKSTLNLLRQYYKVYKPQKMTDTGLLFPGKSKDGSLSQEAVNRVLAASVKTAGIQKSKPITMHTLRHTFATIMMEKGTNLVQLKNLLGHSSISSTAIYTHVAANNDSLPPSPADL